MGRRSKSKKRRQFLERQFKAQAESPIRGQADRGKELIDRLRNNPSQIRRDK